MSRDTTERTDACHVVTMKALVSSAIPKGAAVDIVADYMVDNLNAQTDFTQGVTLEPHLSGVYECIPVVLPGPVIRVIAGSGILAGELVNGDSSTPGEWIVDADNPAGFALEGADDGDEFDVCYVGEQL